MPLSASMLLWSLVALAEDPAPAAGPARTWSALRVSLDCEGEVRVNACTYVRGFLDGSELFLVVPRGQDQVRLIVGGTDDADDDLVMLRFVSQEPGLVAQHQIIQRVSSRAATDAQREVLERAFNRGVAVYLSAVNPEAVRVTLTVPEDATKQETPTSPWGASAWAGGWGSWTGGYRDLSLWGGASLYRTTNTSKFSVWGGSDLSVSRSPSLDVEGHTVSLSSDSWSGYGTLALERHLSDHWSTGLVLRGARENPEAQYAGTLKAHAGLSYDWFMADDPRGNRLSVTWIAGGQADAYNTTNQLGEDTARFPSHLLIAGGSVRTDHAEFSLDAGAGCQINHPLRRNILTLNGSADLTLGDHVDLGLYGAITRQAIPGPAEIDTSSYEAVTQADYAEPLSLEGNINLNIHRSNSNGARNDRFRSASQLDAADNL